MKLSMIGSGYVGLVTGACFAEVGNDVMCFDVDATKINALREGRIPIFEPGLAEMVARNVRAGRLQFSTDAKQSAAFGQVQFIAVGTPADEDGSADMRHVISAARAIGQHMEEDKIVVDKSTVPVGTAEQVRDAITQELAKRGRALKVSVASNPEFLKEGAAIEDFMRPDRIIVGTEDEATIEVMRALYAPFQRNHERLIIMDVRSAELTKYAANAMLATRISFMNELALLSEQLGVDIENVRRGIGSDPRIGYQFLYPGCGYGGSCFPKDVRALQHMANGSGREMQVLRAVHDVNEAQKMVIVDKIVRRFGADLTGRQFALWGLAFKPNTDDMREAPSISVVQALTQRGARVVAYDPVAAEQAKLTFARQPNLRYADSPMHALQGSDALAIVTEWKEFRSPDFVTMRAVLHHPVIFDGRNMYEPALIKSFGFEYFGIGRQSCYEAESSAAHTSSASRDWSSANDDDADAARKGRTNVRGLRTQPA